MKVNKMTLMPNEIEVLNKLRHMSNETWFQIKTPNYIWDADNQVRLETKQGVKEFLQCVGESINDLSDKMRKTVRGIYEKTFDVSEYSFDKFDYLISGFVFK